MTADSALAAPAPALEPEWDDLADRAGAEPWLRPGWIRAWRAAFGSGDEVTVDVRRDGRLAGFAVLERRSASLVSPANWHTPSWAFLAEDAEAERELAERALAHRPQRLTVLFVRPERAGALRAAAEAHGYRLHARVLERSPYVDLARGVDAFEAGLGRKLRSELRRRRRRLEELGAVELDVAGGGERLDELLSEGFAVEASSWKGERGTAIASDPATEAFYREVGRWAADRGLLRLAFLRVGGRAVAFDLAIEDGRAHYLLKTGYDPELRRCSPGMLLREEQIRRAFDAGLESYEFLGDAAPWKLEWTSDVRTLLRVDAFAPSLGGRAQRVAYAYGRPLAKRALALVRR